MTASGTRHDIGDYRASGFAAPLAAMPADGAARTLARLEAVDVDLPHPWYYKSYLLFTWMDRLVRRPAILDAVERLTGPDIMVMSADIWTKPARDGRHVSFHQDAGYWNLDPLDIVTAWVALTPATPANGCMRFLPGTHRLGRVVHDERQGADNMLSHGQTARIDTAMWPVYENELEPGAMSLHHALLVHGSGPNTTDSPRTGSLHPLSPGTHQVDRRTTGVGHAGKGAPRGQSRSGAAALERSLTGGGPPAYTPARAPRLAPLRHVLMPWPYGRATTRASARSARSSGQ